MIKTSNIGIFQAYPKWLFYLNFSFIILISAVFMFNNAAIATYIFIMCAVILALNVILVPFYIFKRKLKGGHRIAGVVLAGLSTLYLYLAAVFIGALNN